MERVVIIVLVSLAMVKTEASPQDNLTTIDEFFNQEYGLHLDELSLMTVVKEEYFPDLSEYRHPNVTSLFDIFVEELLLYTRTLIRSVASKFSLNLGNVTAESVYDDLNGHCAEHLETRIVNLRDQLTNSTCVVTRLRELVAKEAKRAIELVLPKLSRYCDLQGLGLCASVDREYTRVYETRLREELLIYVQDVNDLELLNGTSPLDILSAQVFKNMFALLHILVPAKILTQFAWLSTAPASLLEPFTFENIIYPSVSKHITEYRPDEHNITTSHDELTWGVIRSHTGDVKHRCSKYRDKFSRTSALYYETVKLCFHVNISEANGELYQSVFKNLTARALAWNTAPSLYFNSQCLCVASKGTNCRVTEHQGVDTASYCLSVLLQDFQRQVSFRPAVTYLDYAFQVRVPVCVFSRFLLSSFSRICESTALNSDLALAQSVQCYFNTMVSKELNCSQTLLISTYNHSVLCGMRVFMGFVVCDEESDESRVPYYGVGDSPLVQVLTYVDVTARLLTMVTYLACPQLRNLPGKLLIAYQATALLRLVVVRASLLYMSIAVRIDVLMDLASTLWLTAYLHFLTISIKTLRLPDSLSPEEARMVLIRYALFGWVLPASLSTGFFWMDDSVNSRMQIGQLLFVLCNYVALLGNLYMFYHNCSFYYEVKNSARQLKRGVTARSIFSALLNFALKTSVLSGAGITIRLAITQIQGLVDLLGYYHALGTLQGLLLFFLYGCNREARDFWFSVFHSTLRRCINRRPSTRRPHNYLELEQIPTNRQNISS